MLTLATAVLAVNVMDSSNLDTRGVYVTQYH